MIYADKNHKIKNDTKLCPENSSFVECSNICPEITCSSYKFRNFCKSLRCGLPKCQCKEGYIRLNGPNSKCVKPEKCSK